MSNFFTLSVFINANIVCTILQFQYLCLIPGSVIKNKETEFAKNLLQLSQQPQFNLRHFETVIDEIRSYVAEVSLTNILCSRFIRMNGHCEFRLMKLFPP